MSMLVRIPVDMFGKHTYGTDSGEIFQLQKGCRECEECVAGIQCREGIGWGVWTFDRTHFVEVSHLQNYRRMADALNALKKDLA